MLVGLLSKQLSSSKWTIYYVDLRLHGTFVINSREFFSFDLSFKKIELAVSGGRHFLLPQYFMKIDPSTRHSILTKMFFSSRWHGFIFFWSLWSRYTYIVSFTAISTHYSYSFFLFYFFFFVYHTLTPYKLFGYYNYHLLCVISTGIVRLTNLFLSEFYNISVYQLIMS